MKFIVIIIVAGILFLIIVLIRIRKNKLMLRDKLNQKFPEPWKEILAKRVLFYKNLNRNNKKCIYKKKFQ